MLIEMIPGWPAMGEAPLDQNIKATGWEKVHDNCFSVSFDLKIPTSDLYTLQFPLWEESSKRAVERFAKLHEIDCRLMSNAYVLVQTEEDAVLLYLGFA